MPRSLPSAQLSSTWGASLTRCVMPLACAALALLMASPLRAAGQRGLTPGLWYVKLVSQSIDGHELPQPMLSEINPADEQLLEVDDALAQDNDPRHSNETCTNGSLPDQSIAAGSLTLPNGRSTYQCTLPQLMHERADAGVRLHALEQAQKDRPSPSFQICVTPQMARLNVPVLDRQDICRPTVVRSNGKRETLRFSCRPLDSVVTGTGQAILAPGRITSRIESTVRSPKGDTHTVKSETEMDFVSADCGGVKPGAG